MVIYNGIITKENMPENGIFVFGSNTISINGNLKKMTGGAALYAVLNFGLEPYENMNNCFSKNRKCYGLVTVKAPKVYIKDDIIINNIKLLYNTCINNTNLLFYVAYNGEDPEKKTLNGRKIKNFAKLFQKTNLEIPSNLIFEKNFYKLIIK